MPGDGNCLFHSISYPYGNHRMVRACIVRYIARNWDEFKHFIVTEERGDYLKEMIRPGTWGDEIVLRAFSDLAKRRVRVYSSPQGEAVAQYGDCGECVNLLFDGNHYDFLH